MSTNNATPLVRRGSKEEYKSTGDLRLLSSLDHRLSSALKRGDIAIVRSAWLLSQPPGYKIVRRQSLVQAEAETEDAAASPPPSPFLSGDEAVEALSRCDRSIGVLSHGWLSSTNPDPSGERMELVRQALEDNPHLVGIFWDFASLFQWPRTEEQEDSFRRSIDVMGDLYASAVGTTLLKIEEIPPRPAEFDGAVALYGVADDADESRVRIALRTYGAIDSVELSDPPGGTSVVRFSSHTSALAATRGSAVTGLCAGVGLLYNERSYAGRQGEAGREDDTGRGWCCFEASISGELISRLVAYPKMRRVLEALPPKILLLSRDRSTIAVRLEGEKPGGALTTRVGDVVERISAATFTGAADAETVPALYEDYVLRLVETLQNTLHLAASELEPHEEMPPPRVGAPVPSPLRLAAGQLVLVSPTVAARGGTDDQAGSSASHVLGAVDQSGLKVVRTLGVVQLVLQEGARSKIEGDTLFSFDECSQAVLPWRPTLAEHWERALVESYTVLSPLESTVRKVQDHAMAVADRLQRAIVLEGIIVGDGGQLRKRSKNGEGPPSEDDLQKLLRRAVTVEDLHYVLGEAEGAFRTMRAYPVVYDAHNQRAEKAIRAAFHDAFESVKINMTPKPEPDRAQGCVAAVRKALHTTHELMIDAEMRASRALRANGALGVRRYAAGQMLTVRYTGRWVDAEVVVSDGGATHTLRLETGGRKPEEKTVFLFPWNHAPREMPRSDFDILRGWYVNSLSCQHAFVIDPLSGRRLHVLEQCVAIDVLRNATTTPPQGETPPAVETGTAIGGARNLIAWLQGLHAARLDGSEVEEPSAALITAPPAAGKTTIVSQMVMLSLDGEAELIPIVVRAQQLHLALQTSRAHFTAAWNYVDAFLQLGHDEEEDPQHAAFMYRFLRQVMMARRAILLIDGLDEGGSSYEEIRRHVVEVLAPQGHVVVATSRPGSIRADQFGGFHMLSLSCLSDEQQRQTLTQRLGSEEFADSLLEYVTEYMPVDSDSGGRISANPLMLSLFASVYELRQGIAMPTTTAELYQIASEAMLTRGGITSIELRKLLQVVFFRAQVSGHRVITADDLAAAATSIGGKGDGAHAALSELKGRVLRGHMPLFALLQAEPLQVQSSHLSFQEYFAARALCKPGTPLAGTPPPWQWPIGWANTVTIGEGMGDAFGKGLVRLAGVRGGELNLSGENGGAKLGGNRGVALRAVMQMTVGLKILKLGRNSLGAEGAMTIADMLMVNTSLTSLDLFFNELGPRGAYRIGEALKVNTTLKELNLERNRLRAEGAESIANALRENRGLTSLNLQRNRLDAKAARMLAEALRHNKTLETLDLFNNNLDAEGEEALADTINVSPTLKDVSIGTTIVVKPFTPENVLHEAEAESASSLVTAPQGPAAPLPPLERELVSTFARRRQQMDRTGALDTSANLTRVSAMLRAEAFRMREFGAGGTPDGGLPRVRTPRSARKPPSASAANSSTSSPRARLGLSSSSIGSSIERQPRTTSPRNVGSMVSAVERLDRTSARLRTLETDYMGWRDRYHVKVLEESLREEGLWPRKAER